jgi:hypothetical protein
MGASDEATVLERSEAGAPGNNIAVTPAMIAAALPVFTEYFMRIRYADQAAIELMLSDSFRRMAVASKDI